MDWKVPVGFWDMLTSNMNNLPKDAGHYSIITDPIKASEVEGVCVTGPWRYLLTMMIESTFLPPAFPLRVALCFPQFSMDAVTEVVVDTKPQTKASSSRGSIAL